MGWEEKCGGAYVCGPHDSLVPVDLAGHLSHWFSPRPAVPVPSPPCLHPSGVLKATAWNPGVAGGSKACTLKPTAFPSSPLCLCASPSCLGLLASALHSPPRLSALSLSQSQFPGIIAFSGRLPSPCQARCWEIPTSQAPRGFSRGTGG